MYMYQNLLDATKIVSIKSILSSAKYIPAISCRQCEAAILEREEACKGCPTFIPAFFRGRTSGMWCICVECKQGNWFHWAEKAEIRMWGTKVAVI